MGHRFYVETAITSDRATLSGAESHHLQHVMRANVGDEVVLLDGSGREFLAQVLHLERSKVELTIVESQVVDRELQLQLSVGAAFPKGDRQRWLIEKMVELGVARVIPLRTARSVVHLNERSLQRLHRTVVEASKQCGRNRLMKIGETMQLEDYLQSAPDDTVRWIADKSGARVLHPGDAEVAQIAVGPEGGFTDAEIAGAESAGWQVISLGKRTLRIETACAVMATLVSR